MRSLPGRQWMRSLAPAGAVALPALLVVLNGCAVGPDFAPPPLALNDQWAGLDGQRATAQAATGEQWWRSFQDPVLEQLIQQAYRQNLPLQVAGLRILEARAQLGIAVGQQYPQQELFGGASALGFSKNAPNSAALDRFVGDYQVGFDAAWELDFWGKYRRNVEAENANLNATVAEYDAALVSLVAEVARTYALLRTDEELIALARQNVVTQEEGLQIAEARFRNGATTELDVTQARALAESTKASIPQLQIRWQRAQNALCTLLGQPVGQLAGVMAGPGGIPTAPAQVAVGVPAELLRRRPDIRSAELAALAQNARIGLAKADLYPSFSLTGEIGWETASGNTAHARNLFDRNSVFYALGPTVRWPILQYGRVKNNVRVQDARFQQALLQYQETVLKAAQEVDDALVGFLKSQDAAVFDQNAVTAAKRSVTLALVQYREGAVDYQRVLDTQRSLLQAENSLTQTRSAITTHLIALYKALGGGWELRQGQPVVAAGTQAQMRERTDWGRQLPTTPEEVPPPLPARELPLLPRPEW